MARRLSLHLEALEDRTVPTLMGNTLFPADSPWNQNIANAPVAANSATLVASIGSNAPLHPDFGTTWAGSLNGIPYNVVTGTQPAVPVVVDGYPDESDLVPIPIPAGVVIEGDPLPAAQNTGDRHMIIYDQTNNIVYETDNTHRPAEETDGKWHADSEAVWNLNDNTFRTAGYTSADAAGLPILPGLVRADEVLQQGAIDHALRFTVSETDNSYVFPASHEAGINDSSLPRMGERFRLKANVDISGFSAADQVILTALKQYGMIVADNGGPWYLSGAPSSSWSDDDLHNLTSIIGSDFEAVDLAPVVSSLSAASGPSTGGTSVTINGLDFSGGAGMTQVYFGAVPAASVTVISDTQIVATAPAQLVGTVDVTVHSPYGISATSVGDRFIYGTPPNDAANQEYIANLYLQLLQRPAGAPEKAGWAGVLDQGVPRAQVVQGIENSQEHLGRVVNGLFGKLLGRQPNANERQNYVGWMQSGVTLEQVAMTMVTSVEYTTNHAANAAYVQSLYTTILGRAAGANEVASWNSVLPTMGRTGVAWAVLTSFEFRADAVEQMYGFQLAPSVSPASLLAPLLGRTAAPSWAEVSGWADTALDVRTMEGQFAGSGEFYAK